MTSRSTIRSATLVTQVLISGTVEDGLTGDVPAGALTVTLIDRNSGEQFPLNQKLQKDGRFAFFGAPETVFPLLANQDYPLKVEASADNYQTASFDFSVGPEAGQPEEVTRVMTAAGVEDTTVKVFNGGGLPVSGIVLILARNQVVLTGKVHESGDPFKGIAGALVEVLTSSQTVADGEGDFQMPQSLPLAESVEIAAEASGFESARITYEPDYSQPINYVTVALRPTS